MHVDELDELDLCVIVMVVVWRGDGPQRGCEEADCLPACCYCCGGVGRLTVTGQRVRIT